MMGRWKAAISGLLIAALAYGWIAAASALFCLLAGDWSYYVFPFDQWLYVAPYYAANWYAAVCVILSAAVAALIPIGGVMVWRGWRRWSCNRSNQPAPDGGITRGLSDNHGHAEWASQSRLLQDLGDKPDRPGCLIGAATWSGPLLFDDTSKGPTHSMSFAGPGSFKTMSAITRIWHWPGPVVGFDPSCEIGPIMTKALQDWRRHVLTVDLAGHGFNVLDWIDITHPEAESHIRSAVTWIYNENAPGVVQQSTNPFWSNQGRSLVTCLMAHVLYSDNPRIARNLSTVRRGIAIPENQLQNALTWINANSGSRMAAELAGGLMGMRAPQTFSGIYTNAFSATEWLSTDVYADAVSGDSFRSSDILQPNTVLFVQIPLRTLLATPALGRAIMGALFNAMFHDDSGQGERILFQIDEAAILGALPDIKLCHTTARKYRGTLSTIYQSEGQLEAVWGKDDAKVMRDTCSWRSFNAVQDGDIADRLSRDLGEYPVLATSHGDNSGRHKPWGIALPSGSKGQNTNVHEIKRRLIKGDEILRAPAYEMFVLKRDYPHPIKCSAAPYFLYPEVARVMQTSRFTTQGKAVARG